MPRMIFKLCSDVATENQSAAKPALMTYSLSLSVMPPEKSTGGYANGTSYALLLNSYDRGIVLHTRHPSTLTAISQLYACEQPHNKNRSRWV
ncbi:hypothetical protein SAMN05216325_12637 [Nitrosomonas marina]|uniref:Uncharacterized protein n=1 Tax=Nitrosomonas marina TaxID=917 RepID=A0A1H8HUB2_9PROT|nr:hypothetical protein SAMN05216325_12637 [Nitrosomonas marina]